MTTSQWTSKGCSQALVGVVCEAWSVKLGCEQSLLEM